MKGDLIEYIKILEKFILWIKREGIEDSYEKEILALEHLIKEYKKKDMIIEKMAIYLADIDFDECCAEIPEPCLGCSWEDYEPHTNCIIEYFTKEVEREVEQ